MTVWGGAGAKGSEGLLEAAEGGQMWVEEVLVKGGGGGGCTSAMGGAAAHRVTEASWVFDVRLGRHCDPPGI